MNDFLTHFINSNGLLLQASYNNSSSDSIELFEYVLVAIIISIQGWFFIKTKDNIKRFKQALPDVNLFSLKEITVYSNVLKEVPPLDLLANLRNFEQLPDESTLEQAQYDRINGYIDKYNHTFDEAYALVKQEDFENKELSSIDPSNPKTTLTLLIMAGDEGEILAKIRQSINTYLIRNKGAIADFNLLRDIVQRNLDTVEEEIAVTTPIPVYLGLVGTMLGIIIGLFSLPDIDSETFIQGNGIANLLGGVKIAMIASAMGLILTVYTNGILFRGAKSYVESQKNDLFTFLQTELLPILSESVNSGIVSLNRSLDRFGVQFLDGIKQLEGLVQKNYDSLRAQQSTLESVLKIDVSKVANFNVGVLSELSKSMSALEKLAFSLKNVDTFVVNSQALVERSQDVLGLTDKIGQVIEYTKELQFYLNGHFQDLESRGNLITGTVARLDDVITREIDGLEKNIHARIRAVGEIKVEEDAWLQQAMRENQTALSKLKLLEPLQASLNDFIKENTTAQRSLATTMQNVAKKSSETNEILVQILNAQQKNGVLKQVSAWFFEKRE